MSSGQRWCSWRGKGGITDSGGVQGVRVEGERGAGGG